MIKQAGYYDIAAGDLLIAPPLAQAGQFNESVILVGLKDEHGTQGWVINRPTGHRVSEILKDYDIQLSNDPELYWGGPVSHHTVWLLHSTEWRLPNTRQINDHWSVTSNERMFHYLAEGDAPRYFKVVMGYSGWNAGQLEEELRGEPPRKHSNSWLVLRNPDSEWISDRDDDELWREAVSLSVQQSVNRLF